MATLVTFHAHPDDECITCGGVMRKAHEDGHRVVLVVATRGERGETPEGLLAEGEALAERRVRETEAAAEILGATRVEFLDYEDSGMIMGPRREDLDQFPERAFWRADVDKAAEELATILREENAEVLTCYDDHGGYGHPDHIQVHRVGVRAAELAGTPRVYQATTNRDHLARLVASYRANNPDVELPDVEGQEEFGTPESAITTTVDVRAYAEHKRAAMRAHASQITEDSFFLSLPEQEFLAAFGTEWFIGVGEHVGSDDLFS